MYYKRETLDYGVRYTMNFMDEGPLLQSIEPISDIMGPLLISEHKSLQEQVNLNVRIKLK